MLCSALSLSHTHTHLYNKIIRIIILIVPNSDMYIILRAVDRDLGFLASTISERKPVETLELTLDGPSRRSIPLRPPPGRCLYTFL
jgi:hypothetical protein